MTGVSQELGLVSLGHVSRDSSEFKANSSNQKAMSYERLRQREQELCEEIEALTCPEDRCDEEEDRVCQGAHRLRGVRGLA